MKRDFTPGSEWVYFKLYMGEKSVDNVLIHAIKPLVEELSGEGVIDRFFFLRYSDTHFHLRVRFHLTDLSGIGALLAAFNRHVLPLYERGTIWNIQLDTYKREIERYGEQNIGLIEELYFRNSVATLAFLEAIEGDPDREELRWQGAVRFIDDLLELFGCGPQEKLRLMTRAKDSFLKEFGFTTAAHTKPINTKYRNDLPKIEAAVRMKAGAGVGIEAGMKTDLFARIHAANMQLKPLIASMPSEDALILDVIHLAMNRIFMFDMRKHEMVLYCYLSKFYESAISRANYDRLP